MDVIVARQGALDVHKEQVTACARIPGADRERVQDVKQFKTTVGGLLVLADWLKEHGVTHVVMEATGDFWEAGLARPGGRFRVDARERSPRQESSGPQDRRR